MSDFESFLNEEDSGQEAELSSELNNSIRQTRALLISKLNPSWTQINTKLLGVHIVASLVSLSLCDQFGVRLFFEGPGLMHLFMNLGFWACMGLCGAFYIGFTFFVFPFFLSIDEKNKMQSQLPILTGATAVLSIATLFLLGASTSFTVVLVWLLGAEIAGMVSFKLATWTHKQLRLH